MCCSINFGVGKRLRHCFVFVCVSLVCGFVEYFLCVWVILFFTFFEVVDFLIGY